MKQMTIKQLADRIGVSKTAVRKYFTEDFREKYTAIDRKGVISISPEGCKLIAAFLERSDKLTENTENKCAETTENTTNTATIPIPVVIWNTLQAQLEEKDRQLAAKDEQIRNLTEATKFQAQSINADRHTEFLETAQQKQLSSSADVLNTDVVESTIDTVNKKTGWFSRLFGKK